MGDLDGERRLTRQGQERKQQLLDHAARLFSERGYSVTRVIDIVRAAGVAKGLFYWYFDNKEAVFRELVEQSRDRLRQDQGQAIDPDADPLTRIRQGTEASVRFVASSNRLYNMSDIETLDPDLTQALRTSADVHVLDAARHIKAGIDAGLIRDEDPVLLAWTIAGAVSNATSLLRSGRVEVDLDEMATFTSRWVVRALAASEEIAAAVERGNLELAVV